MKTKILITIICACSLFTMQAQEWGYVSTLQNEWLRKIWTQGLDTVYIVGENGLIARSIDQAETWNKQYFPTKVALNDIIFIDYHTGFAVGEQGAILKTTNAGDTWKQITLAVSSQINAIAATGLDNIWAVGDNSLILHSTDAGETWEQKNILPENNRGLTDIAFRGNLGYFIGNYATVYKTEDYGVTWTKQLLTEQSEAGVSDTFYAINIMESKSYIMFNSRVFFTEDHMYWNNYELGWDGYGPRKMGLFFLNDHQGYHSYTFNGLTVSNSNEDNYGYIPSIRMITSGGNWSDMSFDWRSILRGQYPSNPQYLDIRFVNSTLGYAIFGQTLLKYPKPLDVKLNDLIAKNVLELLQLSDNELLIKSQFNPIIVITICDISGKMYIYEKLHNPVSETIINISNLPKAVYIIKITHDDDTVSNNKYLKR